MDWFNLVIENIGALLAVILVVFNLAVWLARRARQKREHERYGHYAPAVRHGRLNYEEYKKRRES